MDDGERRSLAAALAGPNGAPAQWVIVQPPCDSGRGVEIQAVALPRGAAVRRGVGTAVVEHGALREVLTGAITAPTRSKGGFFDEATAVFVESERRLKSEGLDFRHAARTWIHLTDMQRDYAELNRARREFFRHRGVTVLPASTGIGGEPVVLDPGGGTARIALTVLAAAEGEAAVHRPLSTPTLNEAPEYGSDFSRGARFERGGRVLLHLSGTSAVDERGQSVAIGDFDAQAERTFLNLKKLLEGQGARFSSTLSAIAYLKDRRFVDRYREIAARHGLLSAPHTIVEAEVCRPELLLEVELVACR